MDFWYWKNLFNSADDGEKCCSNTTIAFHYITPSQMYVLDFFLYKVKVHQIDFVWCFLFVCDIILCPNKWCVLRPNRMSLFYVYKFVTNKFITLKDFNLNDFCLGTKDPMLCFGSDAKVALRLLKDRPQIISYYLLYYHNLKYMEGFEFKNAFWKI